MYTYKYPHPAITADCVVFCFDGNNLKILLIQRKNNPYAGCWAFPGGFMDMDETVEEAAKRELMEETRFECAGLTQFYVSSTVDRDERERVVTCACMAFVKMGRVEASDDAGKAEWFDFHNLPELAFDHREIVEVAKTKLKQMLYFEPIAFYLLPDTFDMASLQKVYEEILEKKLDAAVFAERMLGLDLLDEKGSGLYSLNKEKFIAFKERNLSSNF
ncbi:MAG: NUDIX hydrolase [Paludibacteraceae bacterium]|nr:NUDIX hydrolase [Paludibacteraceae bacterium]